MSYLSGLRSLSMNPSKGLSPPFPYEGASIEITLTCPSPMISNLEQNRQHPTRIQTHRHPSHHQGPQ